MTDGPPAAPYVIAEIGCNHAGDLSLAKRMISVAGQFCEVDAVKFQKRHPRTLLTDAQYRAPHPNEMHAFGASYGEHREFLEFDIRQHAELREHAENAGVTYSTSVWDLPSARAVAELDPEFIKVPSAANLNTQLLEFLCGGYRGSIHLSLGMTSRAEEEAIVELFRRLGRLHDLVLYACTSGYPVPFEDVCLLEVQRLRSTYGDELRGVGFSGHHLGIAADVAAFALGARYVERHYTLDRTSKGTDHAASLEPDGLRKLTRDLRNVAKALTYKTADVLSIEQVQRDKLKWRP
ncbi:N-acetylneuraminate synthase family protein [Pseudonocardia bannensis]|uniref:N-acetylneuraminate synthase n=1 Tax=Pseudonocardia bannensis TaxID=630973 RepID=A0A848DSR4_9PSEU|nr:N-acetylneuraminate synthase family protein [Pseudonocardia bannensis]NMH95553.1 N-acetylneuraminate synthase [Pseudonocardia bannensis]